MNKVIVCYTFNFCSEVPVDKEVKIIIYVIQAYERGCVAQPRLVRASASPSSKKSTIGRKIKVSVKIHFWSR